MDQALLEYALAMPPELSLHDGWTRAVLREALGPDLPALIRDRIGKADASGVLGRAFAAEDRERVADALSSPGALAPYFDAAGVAALHDVAARSDVAVHDTSRVAATVLATAVLWLGRPAGRQSMSER